MRKLLSISLLAWLLVPLQLSAQADDIVVFSETFDLMNGKGGRDGVYSGNIANSTRQYDNDSWTDNSCGGAAQCLKLGTTSANGVCTTPSIPLCGANHLILTFSAAGWGDTKKNTLTITANEGFTLSGDNIITELGNEEWNDYTVLITVTSGTDLQLTFTGKRGFLDDVVVRTLNVVPEPMLPNDFTFFPNTTVETASKTITLTPASLTTAYYTTDGSTPSSTNGTEALLTTSIPIHGTTTVKAIAYVEDMASSVVTKTYTVGNTVNGISAFRNLEDGTEARIYFSDDEENEARVLYYDESRHQLFLRDKTGTLCIDFGETASFNPTPQYNQHVAGWLVGKRSNENGMPKLVATENTTTDYLAIANAVTEAQTEPKSINNDGLSSHLADWVAIGDQRVGTDISVTNRFGTDAYDGALTDLSGIVIPNESGIQIAPVSQNDISAVVYVIDDSKAFVSPSADIENATVRLKRTLSKDYWNTFAVPFDITTMTGNIREYSHADGNTMVFADAPSIVAGKPYLVKPTTDIIDPVYTNVTLTATAAKTVADGKYSFVATYSPTNLKTDGTELFLKNDGRLYHAAADKTQLHGMRGYFLTETGQTARLAFLGDATGIDVMANSQELKANSLYDLQGRRLNDAHLKRGLYLVNGKKLIVH